jgi:hypothetical protein
LEPSSVARPGRGNSKGLKILLGEGSHNLS